MFDVKRYIDKLRNVVNDKDVKTILEKLPNDPALKRISQNAGLVGAIINVGLTITEKVYEAKVPVQTRLSFTLMRIMLESAKDSLEFDSEVDIEGLLIQDKDSEEMENIVAELFNPKYYDYQKGMASHIYPIIQLFQNLGACLKKVLINILAKISLTLTSHNSSQSLIQHY